MKETQPIDKDQVQLVKQAEVNKHRKMIGRVLICAGHNCYEFNLKSSELRKATFKPQAYVLGSRKIPARVVETKENCIYVTALNSKNAVKKLRRDYRIDFVIEPLK